MGQELEHSIIIMRLYKFSPISSQQGLVKAVKYVAKQNAALCKKAIGKPLPLSSVTIFAHYQNEYAKLAGILHKLGKLRGEHNGPRIVLHKPIRAGNHIVTRLRIRKPDPYRMQVGCSDFDTDYWKFKNAHFTRKNKNLRLIERQEYEMIEFFDPNFDVLAYVVSKTVH